MPDQDYEKFKSDAEAAGAPIQTVDGYGGLYYYEKAKPGAMLSYVGKTMRAERSFVVWPYEKAWGFCAHMIGWSYLGDGTGAEFAYGDGDYDDAGVWRQLPQPLPVYNQRVNKPLAWATEVSRFVGLRPSGNLQYDDVPTGGSVAYGDFYAAEVTIVYGSLPYRVLSDEDTTKTSAGDPDESLLKRYVNRVGVPSSRHVQFPSGALKWEGVGLPALPSKKFATQTAGRMLPYTDVVYTWYQVPGVPKVLFEGAIGKVNSVSFDIFAPETLLLTAVDLIPHRMVSGERSFDISFRCRHFDKNNPESFEDGDVPLSASYHFADSGHNYFLRYEDILDGSGKKTGTRFIWDRPFSGPDSGPEKKWVFEAMDFRKLFKGPFTTGLWVAV